MPIVNSGNIIGLIQRTLNHVDARLVDHGKRVAYLVSQMLTVQGTHTMKERQDICMVALLHDIGAYKTDEIDCMVRFESETVWNHSVYGYLFLRDLSPLAALAPAILFHHVAAQDMDAVDAQCREVAQLINLADWVDLRVLHGERERTALYEKMEALKEVKFAPWVMALFEQAETQMNLLEKLSEPLTFEAFLGRMELSEEEIVTYLRMLLYSIDFRSRHTVTHTVTTTRIALCTAEWMNLSPQQCSNVYYGALLHDLGKIGIPVEILEFPGKLSPQAVAVMRTHVDLTEEILAKTVDETVTKIALRHHEKLDGSGYPRGLMGKDLTMEERIVAVADIVSALCGTRSYKSSFPKEKTIGILREMSRAGQLDANVVSLMADRFDELMEEVYARCAPVLATYDGLQTEYGELMKRYA